MPQTTQEAFKRFRQFIDRPTEQTWYPDMHHLESQDTLFLQMDEDVVNEVRDNPPTEVLVPKIDSPVCITGPSSTVVFEYNGEMEFVALIHQLVPDGREVFIKVLVELVREGDKMLWTVQPEIEFTGLEASSEFFSKEKNEDIRGFVYDALRQRPQTPDDHMIAMGALNNISFDLTVGIEAIVYLTQQGKTGLELFEAPEGVAQNKLDVPDKDKIDLYFSRGPSSRSSIGT